MSAFGEDVVAVIEKLGLRKVVLAGHSMGGFVIVEAARQMPERVVGLIGADSFQIVGERNTKAVVSKSLPPPADFESALRTWLSQKFPPGSDPALVEQIADEMCSTPPEIAYPVHDEMMTNGQRQGEGLLELKMKTITINESDGQSDADAFAKYDIEVMPMSGGGPFVMLEDPETFNRLLAKAIDAIVTA
jgi:pimeloyl-ACP methyl ester carboxylesterase